MTPDAPREPILLQRLVAVHKTLTAAGFDHAIGGAIALAVHVREPRFTADIDLNVTADPNRPTDLLQALPSDVEIHPTASADIQRDGQTRVVWRNPITPLDLFLPQHPIYHRLVVQRAVPWQFPEASIKVMTATDLIVFKMLFNRSQDWVDIENLIEAGTGDPDEAISWITDFIGTDDNRIRRLRALLT